jgi:hypothetical protein
LRRGLHSSNPSELGFYPDRVAVRSTKWMRAC